ncbi:MAG: hypothetical protein ACU84Q_09440 [Gammaproteobacteria bacterium]
MAAQKGTADRALQTPLESSEHGDLHCIGDECLGLAGPMPARSVREPFP